jgi:hypothetical protein
MQVVVDHERDPERHSCYRQRFTRLAGLSDTPRDGGFIPVQATNGARPARGRAADIDAEIELHTPWITGMIHSVGWLSRAPRFRNAGSSERLD